MNRNGNMQIFEFEALPIPIFQKYNTLKQQKFLEKNHYKQLQPNCNNLLFRNQVVKGKTFLNRIGMEQIHKGTTKSKQKPSKKTKKKILMNESFLNDVKPKEGYQHASCNTDIYKEVLEDNIITHTISVQTDPLLNRPVQRQFKEYKSGIDQSTQIEESDGLKDFEKQVQPVVRVLLNKILEESRMELLEEIELENMKNQRRVFQQKKMALLNQVQKINEEKSRYKNEQSKRANQSLHSKQNIQSVHQKLVCKFFSQKVMNQITQRGFDVVIEKEDFFQTYENEVYLKIIPQCYKDLQEILHVQNYCKFLSENFVQELNENIINSHVQTQLMHEKQIIKNKEQKKLQQIEKEEYKKKRKQEKIINKIKIHLKQNMQNVNTDIKIQSKFELTDTLSIKGQNFIYMMLSFFSNFNDLELEKQKIQSFLQKLFSLFIQLKINLIVYINQDFIEQIKQLIEIQEDTSIIELITNQLMSEEKNQWIIDFLKNYILDQNDFYQIDEKKIEIIKYLLEEIMLMQKQNKYKLFEFCEQQDQNYVTHLLKIKKDLINKQEDQVQLEVQTQQEQPQKEIQKIEVNQQLEFNYQVLQKYNFVNFNLSQRFETKFFIYQENFMEKIIELICESTKIFESNEKQQQFIKNMIQYNQQKLNTIVEENELEIIEIDLDNQFKKIYQIKQINILYQEAFFL